MASKKDIEQSIRERAFQIWIEEGKPHGRDKLHWQQALAELLSSTSPTVQSIAEDVPPRTQRQHREA